MADRTDGGAAFPTTLWEERAGVQYGTPHPGMSLRDWFAGQALAGILAFPHEDHPVTGGGMSAVAAHYADIAYAYADAMIAAQKGGPESG